MRAIVVHESLFGNTTSVAEAVAQGLRGRFEVTLVRAAEASPDALRSADFVVLGAPTHAHGMPGKRTRAMAVRSEHLAAEVATAPGIKELLASIGRVDGIAAAAFDTRLRGNVFFTGAASHGIARRLRRAGFALVAEPESFLVTNTRGPLVEGEIERASAWGASIAEAASGHRVGPAGTALGTA